MQEENQYQVTVPNKAVLDSFLADNSEMEELSAKLATFNIFRALKIEKMEIRHSNVLAWLLNPEENHGFGEIALRRFFSNMLLGKKIDGISAAEIEMMHFDDVEVRREYKNIDILIIDHKNQLVFLIENKIHAKEHPFQLVKYKNEVQKFAPNYKLIPVFLTLTGDGVNDEDADDYICYSYVEVICVLEKLLNQRGSQLSEPVIIFLNQYLETLRRLTMQDETLVKLCKAIYQKHRDAIEMIVEYGTTGAGQEIVEELLNKEGGFEILNSSSQSVWFIPNSWATYIPENGTVWPRLKRRVSAGCFINYCQQAKQVRFVCEVSKMDDPALRLKTVKALREANFKLSKKAFDIDATYSRFFSAYLSIDDMSDAEELRRAVQQLFSKFKPLISSAEQVFKEVFAK
jgi:hypothetical protein